ncbi:MAG: excinuclease ABC subunit UvrA [bacterium]
MPQNDQIKIKGARVNNLKNINVNIPRDKFVVITGLSGSGKSSLAFDTIYAEGQRRYVESLSAYARQFVGMLDKPDVDMIEGLSPAISIDQRSTSTNPRSTVGTVTEIYDYLRLLYARIGVPHCPECKKPIQPYSLEEIIEKVSKGYIGKEITILAPLVQNKKGEHKSLLDGLSRAGFRQVRFDNQLYSLAEFSDLDINEKKKHNLELVVESMKVTKEKEDQTYLVEMLKRGLEFGNDLVIIQSGKVSKLFSKKFACPDCDISIQDLEPRSFSFNSPQGACPDCFGLGTKMEIDPDLVFNKRLTINQGGIKPWVQNNINGQAQQIKNLGVVASKYKFDLNTEIKDLNKKQLDIILYGCDDFEGVVPVLEKRYQQTDSDYLRKEIESYMRSLVCPVCKGKRLKPEILAVSIAGKSINDVVVNPINKLHELFAEIEAKLNENEKKIARQIIKEILLRLDFLKDVGLGYIQLDRRSNSLSGGEAQRIRLATQIGTGLTGVIYILDEPSIGLHQRDNDQLIQTLKNLRNIGNTVIVVEHDEATMLAADHIIDIGPGAGEYGGKLVAEGTPAEIKKDPKSLTGQYLSGKKNILAPKQYRKGNNSFLKILKASEHNLKNIDVKIPLGKFVAITGVSGSGKSTLMTDILSKKLSQHFYRAKAMPGAHKGIEGLNYIDKVINIDQSPIGRTPRSNPATYTGLFTPIRDLFAELPEAEMRRFKAGHFSFNVVGGRCETCSGDGVIKIEMQFLQDIYMKCDTCHGRRYKKEVLDIHYQGKNISDVLNMTVAEAKEFFYDIPNINQKLKILSQVGLDYIKLGQSATTLSGGEAQRVKLATELSRRSTGKTLYILDEPTTGLHFEDIKRLLAVLQKLVDKGNTVLIIEHNLDVIKSVDWVIDLGPDGGDKGGRIVAEGTPADVAKIKKSYTGQYLSKVLK